RRVCGRGRSAQRLQGRRPLSQPDHDGRAVCGVGRNDFRSIADLAVIARSDSDEAIHSVHAARWIASWSLSSGRAFARTRWLAMTIQPNLIPLQGITGSLSGTIALKALLCLCPLPQRPSAAGRSESRALATTDRARRTPASVPSPTA